MESGRDSAAQMSAWHVAAFGAAYFGGVAIAYYLSFSQPSYWPFWPPSGLFLGMLLVCDRRDWLRLWGTTLIASLAGDLVFEEFRPEYIPVSIGIWLANTLESLLAAWILRRRSPAGLSLICVGDFVALIVIGIVLTPALAATLGAGFASLIPGSPSFAEGWLRWWIGDAVGVMTVAPVVLAWAGADVSPRVLRRGWAYHAEFAAYCVALLVIAGNVFYRAPEENTLAARFPFFLINPLMLWAGFRFEPRRASLSVLLLGIIVTWCTTRGYGSIARYGEGVVQQGLLLQGMLAQASFLTLLFSSSIERREIVETSLQRKSRELSHAESEARRQKDLLQSILDSMGEGVIVVDKEANFILFNPSARRLHRMGPEPVPPQEWPRTYQMYLPDGVTPCPVDQVPLVRALRGDICDGVPLVFRPLGQPDVVYARVNARPIRAADGSIVGAVAVRSDISALVRAEQEQSKLIAQLQTALSEIRTLQGLIPICANCKRIRNDAGAWERLESYFRAHTGAEFTHGICPECGPILYGDVWVQAMQDTVSFPEE